jgi:hypothetical protein
MTGRTSVGQFIFIRGWGVGFICQDWDHNLYTSCSYQFERPLNSNWIIFLQRSSSAGKRLVSWKREEKSFQSPKEGTSILTGMNLTEISRRTPLFFATRAFLRWCDDMVRTTTNKSNSSDANTWVFSLEYFRMRGIKGGVLKDYALLSADDWPVLTWKNQAPVPFLVVEWIWIHLIQHPQQFVENATQWELCLANNASSLEWINYAKFFYYHGWI